VHCVYAITLQRGLPKPPFERCTLIKAAVLPISLHKPKVRGRKRSGKVRPIRLKVEKYVGRDRGGGQVIAAQELYFELHDTSRHGEAGHGLKRKRVAHKEIKEAKIHTQEKKGVEEFDNAIQIRVQFEDLRGEQSRVAA
jgi:hypothetical protein